jgi:DNA helicase HerA-like ATPase
MSIAKIEPYKIKQYHSKQSTYLHVPQCPFRMLINAPSGSGKTIMIQSLILDIYKNTFSDIFIFSPSVFLDSTWSPCIDYINEMTKNYKSKQQYFFDTFEDDELNKILDNQTELIKFYKENNQLKMPNILIILDDWADDVRLKYNENINSIFVRGRHSYCSCIISSQKYYAISNIIRINASHMICFKIQNERDLKQIIESISALATKKDILAMYNKAVNDQAYSFLYINLSSKNDNKFYLRFEKLFKIKD